MTKRTPPIFNSMDAGKSAGLAHLLASGRGLMVDAAERQAMPDRFSAIPHPDRPAMIIVDEQTGRSTTVPLHAYGATRAAITALFATEPTLVDVEWQADEAAGTLTIYPIYAGVDVQRGVGMSLRYGKDTKLGQRLVAAIRAGATHAPTGIATNVDGKTYALTDVKVMGRTLNADLKRLGF